MQGTSDPGAGAGANPPAASQPAAARGANAAADRLLQQLPLVVAPAALSNDVGAPRAVPGESAVAPNGLLSCVPLSSWD